MMAKMMSAVTTNLGMSERRLSMSSVLGARKVERSTPMSTRPRESGDPGPKAKIWMPAFAGMSGVRVWQARALNLEAFDFLEQRAVLALVGGPDLLLRDFAEFLDL